MCIPPMYVLENNICADPNAMLAFVVQKNKLEFRCGERHDGGPPASRLEAKDQEATHLWAEAPRKAEPRYEQPGLYARIRSPAAGLYTLAERTMTTRTVDRFEGSRRAE